MPEKVTKHPVFFPHLAAGPNDKFLDEHSDSLLDVLARRFRFHGREDLRPMKVHMNPAVVSSLPNSRLFKRACLWRAVGVGELDEACVADDRGIITEHPHVRCADRVVMSTQMAAEVEIELVKVQALDQMAAAFGFERRQGRIAELSVGFPVAATDAVQQSCGQFQQLPAGLFAHRSENCDRIGFCRPPRGGFLPRASTAPSRTPGKACRR